VLENPEITNLSPPIGWNKINNEFSSQATQGYNVKVMDYSTD